MTDLVVKDAASVVPFAGTGPIRGVALSEIEVLERTSVTVDDGVVAAIGEPNDARVSFDASGCTVVPGFVDPHTHLPFFGWRADEDAARLSGLRYESLHREEGGIYRSVQMLADATDDEVVGFCADLAHGMLTTGTTTFETKSGYGLSVDAELRQLRLARRLAAIVPQNVTTSCLSAHAVPKGKTEGEWVGEIAEEILPVVARERLADAVDIYVESIAFQLEHAARLKMAADALGLGMRMHADQLEDSQAGSFAARWDLVSADHLNHTSLDAVEDIAGGHTAAVLLPATAFTLRQNKRPPARALVEAGATVALGSDFNPGTSPISSMPFVISLACRLLGLRPLEALAAATVNAACVLKLDGEAGRIQVGDPAELVVLDVPSFEHVPYRPDHDAVAAVICGGRFGHVAERARGRISS
ncbi:MAG TPA: imidazolonepropionase [Actinomycetota bacterium]|nr:imidazolonepropionase [Actinomycetota bacterium]